MSQELLIKLLESGQYPRRRRDPVNTDANAVWGTTRALETDAELKTLLDTLDPALQSLVGAAVAWGQRQAAKLPQASRFIASLVAALDECGVGHKVVAGELRLGSSEWVTHAAIDLTPLTHLPAFTEVVWQHKRTGCQFRIGQLARWQGAVYTDQAIVIYTSVHFGSALVQPLATFFDGRFAPVDPAERA